MKVPKGMSEEEVLQIIQRVSRSLAPKFRFGYHEIDDMVQFGVMFGIQGLEDYNPDLGSLRTFLWTHIRNRFFNLKRDNFERPDKPCIGCPYYDPNYNCTSNQCMRFDDKFECLDYYKWYNRNSAKRNVINPIELGNVRDEQENGMKIFEDVGDSLELSRAIEAVDQTIPIDLRSLWLMLKNDIPLNKADREKLFPMVRRILEREGVDGT